MDDNPVSSPPLSPARYPRIPSSPSFAPDLLSVGNYSPHSYPRLAASLEHFSELRTKMQDTVVSAASNGICVTDTQDFSYPPDGAPLDCEACTHECETAPCSVELSSECTDQCVVVACSDSHHARDPYENVVFPSQCEPCAAACPNGPDCTVLDELTQCCTGYHPYMADPRSMPFEMMVEHNDMGWDPELAAFFCACSDPSQPEGVSENYTQLSAATSSSASTPQLTPSSVAFHSQSEPLVQPNPPPSHAGIPVDTVPSNAPRFYATPEASQSPQTQVLPHRCQWGGCFASFASLNELVGHVNLQHLRLSSPDAVAPLPATQVADQQTIPGMSGLSCLWADCHVYPTPQSIPGSSTGNTIDAALDILANHLLADHLGLLSTPQQNQAHGRPIQEQNIEPPPVPFPSTAAVSGYSPPTPKPEHDCSASPVHVCRWEGCNCTFPTCDQLTVHITAEHVGAGKAHYECRWDGCTRHGEHGFSSKQKILRHLQSHTGHRPFQCEMCGQYFSEAATLAQHKRRHTQEKPYICDFPGCGKSFAITGALTIHKRTHSGHKPFKCSYCNRAFAESSNLSKHLRTHTGARPYACTEPGCNKSFARPDQLARHQNVHRKKSVEAEVIA